MIKKLLDIKKKIKSKMPKFSRKDSHKKVRIGSKWRKPKGLQNKMRLQLRAHKKIVKAGYRTPSAVRHLNDEGMGIVNVSNLKQLESIDPKTTAVIISAKVSKKTKLSIIESAISKNIKVENVKNLKDASEKIKAEFKSKKEKSDKIASTRKEKKAKLESDKKKESEKEKAKKSEKSEKKDSKESDVKDKKADENKDKKKILTKK